MAVAVENDAGSSRKCSDVASGECTGGSLVGKQGGMSIGKVADYVPYRSIKLTPYLAGYGG